MLIAQPQSIGPHFNPSSMRHGCLDASERHAGDLVRISVIEALSC